MYNIRIYSYIGIPCWVFAFGYSLLGIPYSFEQSAVAAMVVPCNSKSKADPNSGTSCLREHELSVPLENAKTPKCRYMKLCLETM